MQADPMKLEINKALAEAANAAQKMINDNPGVWYPCGFAWVKIKPARGPVVKALKEMGIGGTDAYEGGYRIYNPSGNSTQWMDAKYEGAKVFAEAMKKLGAKAYAEQRMD